MKDLVVRLKHRIPPTMRQHWKLVVVFVAFLGLVAGAFGGMQVRPYITGDPTIITSGITENISGTVDLFDPEIEHEVSVSISDDQYSDMITEFQKTGDKKWVTAEVTIDGTVITDVGVRLKGNSTLMGVRGTDGMPDDGRFPDGPPGGFAPPDGMEPPDGMKLPEGMGLPEGIQPPNGMRTRDGTMPPGGGAPGGPGMIAQADPDDPASLPLLLRFNKNVSGRAYQGMTELSVRPGSPVINEAMALSITAATGQPTQRYGYAVYSVNGEPTTTRLILEHPDDTYANSLFESDGYLYKADASSKLEYVGEDQSEYSDQFKQVNAVGSGTLSPIINFLRWLDSADDTHFEDELADWVDVESFARYVATQNLIVNSDDMSGPGQNYYLWYDLSTKKISVVSWDLNLAMQQNSELSPDESPSMGGPGGGPRDLGGNTLKTRFLDSDAFAALYQKTYWELFDVIYTDGTASAILDGLSEQVPLSDSLSREDLDESVASMRDWITARTRALEASAATG